MNCPICKNALNHNLDCYPIGLKSADTESIKQFIESDNIDANMFYHIYLHPVDPTTSDMGLIFFIKTNSKSYELYNNGSNIVVYDSLNINKPSFKLNNISCETFFNVNSFEEVESLINKLKTFQ